MKKIVPSATRPITILPTIYRLWSKVCTKAVLQRIATCAPVAITGMVPRRGAMDASYKLQAMLEKLGHQKSTGTGLTLDLKMF